MRLSFPNGEHADVVVSGGAVTLGSGQDNDLALAGIAARHARIVVDEGRGIVLEVLDPDAMTHVNARPVRRLALLRLGDVLSLASLRVLLKPDDDDQVVQTAPPQPASDPDAAAQAAASRVVLRGISGPLYGCSFAVRGGLEVGRAADASVRIDDAALEEHHARVEDHGEYVVLRDLGSAEGSVVNGVAVRDAILHPGDQIAFEQFRFVLEAPGLPPRGSASVFASPGSGAGSTQTLRAIPASHGSQPVADTPEPAGGRGNVGWLIFAAVLIMLGLAALLFYAPNLIGG
ncbi:MAG TPA: FHA domain-containing protein [Xanthomonadaceae bacterium]|nr:FHA domain-containing protein [Xanthomonadaceae bacterium]